MDMTDNKLKSRVKVLAAKAKEGFEVVKYHTVETIDFLKYVHKVMPKVHEEWRKKRDQHHRIQDAARYMNGNVNNENNLSGR